MSELTRAVSVEAALRLVVEGTASETGTEFFRALVKNLAAAMDTAGAWVTEYLPESQRLRAYAFWLDGRFVEGFEYNIAGTACEPVVESKKLVHIPDRFIELYPAARNVIAGAVSYLGVALLNQGGKVMGHLSVFDTKTLPADPRLLSLFEIFAARAAAEQRRLRQEAELRVREEELSALLNSAMDAVVVLDTAGVITRVNPATERLFGCTAEDLLGEDLRQFLPPESAAQFDTFAKELDAQSPANRHLWIPHSFQVLRWDKSIFPAEATISRFTNRGRDFHTVILRNVDERVAAERKIALLVEETEYLRESVREITGMGDMLGASPAMKDLFESLRRVAVTDATVLIFGETGTGKELIARSIHQAGARKDKPLIRVNCAAIPAALMDGARDELLADAALAANEHGDVAVGDLLDHLGDAAHLLAVAPHRAVLVVAQLLPQLAQLRDQPVLLDGVLDRDVEGDFAEPLGIVRLDDVVGGAQAHRFDNGRGLIPARQHDDLGFGTRRFERAQSGQAVQARHHHVEQDDIGGFGLFHRREQLVPACVAARFISAQREKGSQVGGEPGIIINNRNKRLLHLSPCAAVRRRRPARV